MNIFLNKSDHSCTVLVAYQPKNHFLSTLLKRVTSVQKDILESRYFNTYKALHVGGKETLESGMIRLIATACSTHSNSEMSQRLNNYNAVTGSLNQLTNEGFEKFLTTADPVGCGIGGEILLGEVSGIPVFIKKIRLTSIEQRNPRSTENLFELSPNYQYGVGSRGFGAWRELSAHEVTTQWVLNGECPHFPLLYHSRVLKRAASSLDPLVNEEIERDVAYWDGSVTVGRRGRSVATASADIVVVMERFSQPLGKWFRNPENLTEESISRVEYEMNRVVAFMQSRGFLHFDAHAGNVLSNGRHVYFADFGLAISREFDLSPQEASFFQQHRHYDRYYVIWALVESIMTAALGKEGEPIWNAYLNTGEISPVLPSPIAAMAEQYRPIVVLMDRFFQHLREVSKNTPYPEAALAIEWAKLQKV